MYGSLFEDDYVVIDKMAYGARLPITPIALKFNGTKKYLDWIQLPYLRFYGYSSIKINDVVAFNYEQEQENPVDMQEEFIKRCVALPGDTLKIIYGDVYTNGKKTETETVYNTYYVQTSEKLDSLSLLRSGIFMDKFPERENNYSLLMSASATESFSKLKYVQSIRKDTLKKENYSPALFPHYALYPWNNDHFGPLWIPKKGDSIELKKENLVLYQQLIERYEKEIFSFKGDTVYIGDKKTTHYTFKQNYYFLLGDNRHNSIDSRVNGPIPEDHILGKATYILFSDKPGRKFLKIK